MNWWLWIWLEFLLFIIVDWRKMRCFWPNIITLIILRLFNIIGYWLIPCKEATLGWFHKVLIRKTRFVHSVSCRYSIEGHCLRLWMHLGLKGWRSLRKRIVVLILLADWISHEDNHIRGGFVIWLCNLDLISGLSMEISYLIIL